MATIQPQVAKKTDSSKTLAQREATLAFWLLLPTFLAMLLIAAYPLGNAFYTSLTNTEFAGTQEPEFVGFANYAQLLSMTIAVVPPKLDDNGNPEIDPDTGQIEYESPVRALPREPRYKAVTEFNLFGTQYVLGARDADFINGIWDTVVFAFWSVILETLLGLGIALVVNAKFPGRGLMRAAMLVPWAIPTVVSARMWEWMLTGNRTGFFNTIGNYLGWSDGKTAFLTDPVLQLPSIIMVDVWKTTPFMALLLLAGLQSIPSDIYEAADIDGAGKIHQFFSITLPLLMPALVVALIFRTLDSLRVFDLFQIVFGQSRVSMASYNYVQLIQFQQAGMASAVGVVIFIILLVFAIAYVRTFGVEEG